MIRRAGEGRYAYFEREQRWIASGVPPAAEYWAEIADRYIRDTRLRLRHTESDEQVVYKLGQKVRLRAKDPETVKLTNVYLSRDKEFAVLAALPAAELRKTLRITGERGAISPLRVEWIDNSWERSASPESPGRGSCRFSSAAGLGDEGWQLRQSRPLSNGSSTRPARPNCGP